MNKDKTGKLPWSWIIRLAGSLLVLGITLALLPREAIWTAFTSIDPIIWVLVLLGFIGGHIVAAMKWRLLASIDNDIPPLRAIRAHGGGLAANLCLPGVAGGDVVRAGIAMRGAQHKTHIAVGSLADRLIDTFALLFIAAIGALLSAAGSQTFGALGQIAVFLVGAVAAAIVFVVALRFVPKLPFAALRRKLGDVAAEFAKKPGRLALCFALSVCVQSMFVGLTILFAHSVGVDLPPAAWFMAWPLAKLIAIIPISLAGLGVREAALAGLLAPFGAAPALVVAASLLWQSVLFAAGGLGAIILFWGPREDRNAANPRSDIETDMNKEPA